MRPHYPDKLNNPILEIQVLPTPTRTVTIVDDSHPVFLLYGYLNVVRIRPKTQKRHLKPTPLQKLPQIPVPQQHPDMINDTRSPQLDDDPLVPRSVDRVPRVSLLHVVSVVISVE